MDLLKNLLKDWIVRLLAAYGIVCGLYWKNPVLPGTVLNLDVLIMTGLAFVILTAVFFAVTGQSFVPPAFTPPDIGAWFSGIAGGIPAFFKRVISNNVATFLISLVIAYVLGGGLDFEQLVASRGESIQGFFMAYVIAEVTWFAVYRQIGARFAVWRFALMAGPASSLLTRLMYRPVL